MARILIVDDAKFMRETIKKMLEKNGFEVVGEAADGLTAVDLYNRLKPDIVTMDINMPTMDGINSIKKIYETDPKCKIVVITSVGTADLTNQAIEAGAMNYITKPFDEGTVVKTLKYLCS